MSTKIEQKKGKSFAASLRAAVALLNEKEEESK
jgi:hypothetical protein